MGEGKGEAEMGIRKMASGCEEGEGGRRKGVQEKG